MPIYRNDFTIIDFLRRHRRNTKSLN
jgi:hypothetical protein